ncbi:MAG TPA: condensation domain-containing protein, partial [Longimicrobium sp.]|nr:condensation domain-containing protein [Longimicrobium sp.]
VVVHHDALRLRFGRAESGWRQWYGTPPSRPLLAFEDLSALPTAERAARVEARCADAQAGMDLAAGPLLRALLFRCGPADHRFFIAIHHLVVDGVSWWVLMDDLWTAYRDLARGTPVHLPDRTAPVREWVSRLREYAGSETLRASFDGFLAAPFHRAGALPVDFPGGGNTVALEATVKVELTADETEALLRQAPTAYRCEINDLLLTALGLALCEWSGCAAHMVDVEGHGREPLFEDVDPSRTVGWFTSICPRLLDVGDTPEPLAALRRVKEHLRSLPHHGIGFGVAYFLGDEALRGRLASLPPREVCFNYMGRFDGASGAPRAEESCGPTRHPAQERGYLLELNGHIADAVLQFEFGYSRGMHAPGTIQAVAHRFHEVLRGFVAEAAVVRERASTPSDFPLANLTQAQLEKLLRRFSAPATTD